MESFDAKWKTSIEWKSDIIVNIKRYVSRKMNFLVYNTSWFGILWILKCVFETKQNTFDWVEEMKQRDGVAKTDMELVLPLKENGLTTDQTHFDSIRPNLNYDLVQ